MSLNLVGCSSEPLFAVFLIGFAILNFLAFFFEFGESWGELISFVGEFAHLTEKDDISEVKSTIFVVVWEVCLWVCVIHESC